MRALSGLVASFLVTLVALGSGCESKTEKPRDDVLKAAVAALDKRAAALRDFRVAGTAKGEGGAAVPFKYRWAQPQFAKVEIADQQTVVFDGTALVTLDHANKMFQRVDKDDGEENLLFALYEAFSEVSVEGWRPPLMRAGATTARVENDRWVLTTSIEGDAQLKEQRVVLRMPDAAFVEKVMVDKTGKEVAATRVLEEHKDEASGLTYPKKWERTGQGRFELTLDEIVVNEGVAKDAFNAEVPAGYKERS